MLKYVDDNVINEKVNFDTVPTDANFVQLKRAIRTENLVKQVIHQAVSRGIKVHSGKTQSLLISELKGYVPKAFFKDDEGNTIQSGNKMKILGFEFSSDPDKSAQDKAIMRKVRGWLWVLYHLKHRGFGEEDLLRVYMSSIIPLHDYCSCMFDSSLTVTQSNALERLQAQALKSIYGYEFSYSSLLERTGLMTLKARRA